MGWRKNKISIDITLVVLIFLFLSNNTSVAQSESLDKESWQELRKDYSYGDVEEFEEEEDLDLDELDYNFKSPFSGFFSSQFFTNAVIGLVIIVLVFLILRLMGVRVINRKIDRSQLNYDYNLDNLEDNLQETDLERILRLALEKNDFRAAIRIYYLKIIKEMSIQNWISWKKDKTNRQYIGELRGKPQQGDFRELTRAFELIWYGELNITAEDYYKLDPLFSTFLKKIGGDNG